MSEEKKPITHNQAVKEACKVIGDLIKDKLVTSNMAIDLQSVGFDEVDAYLIIEEIENIGKDMEIRGKPITKPEISDSQKAKWESVIRNDERMSVFAESKTIKEGLYAYLWMDDQLKELKLPYWDVSGILRTAQKRWSFNMSDPDVFWEDAILIIEEIKEQMKSQRGPENNQFMHWFGDFSPMGPGGPKSNKEDEFTEEPDDEDEDEGDETEEQ